VERIERLVGVYDADGTVLGELAYVVGHALGRRSCSLCEITHGRLRRRPAFDEAVARLGVPVELLHRDEQPTALAALTRDRLPCVVAEGDGDQLVLLDRAALVACAGDPDALVTAVRSAAAALGLQLTESPG
jgi:hypothetical protein